MSTPTWITLANANQQNQTASASAISNFTALSTVSPGGSVAGQAYQTQPAQLYPGQMWRFTANGTWSSTSSPGISLGIYWGTTGSPLCYGSVPSTQAWSGAASVPWTMQAMGKLTAVGLNVGVWNIIGFLAGLAPVTSGATGTSPYPNGAITVMPQFTQAAQYDTSTAQLITLASTCTASSTSNAITVYNWSVEYMTEP